MKIATLKKRPRPDDCPKHGDYYMVFTRRKGARGDEERWCARCLEEMWIERLEARGYVIGRE
jgi:hypothetical protein